ncbi:hypothetical protein HHK36_004662 [Tetracentron sinense]|uniref:Uncharacterized protein n=1 Tax=Tetracentron sinense TaxID=13715 RepID=A0A834ZJI2_TETSI|nr:hypothetical protein HHK36_004662 [Tetracentron sinense]
MIPMGFLWRPKHSSTSSCGGGVGGATPKPATITSTTTARHRSANCCCLMKLVKKLKRHSGGMLCVGSRATTLHYQYDPLSYALNFDDNFDHFYAFSSRYVAIPSGRRKVIFLELST